MSGVSKVKVKKKNEKDPTGSIALYLNMRLVWLILFAWCISCDKKGITHGVCWGNFIFSGSCRRTWKVVGRAITWTIAFSWPINVLSACQFVREQEQFFSHASLPLTSSLLFSRCHSQSRSKSRSVTHSLSLSFFSLRTTHQREITEKQKRTQEPCNCCRGGSNL